MQLLFLCRHLYLPLYNAERAWGYAMQLKEVCYEREWIPCRGKGVLTLIVTRMTTWRSQSTVKTPTRASSST